jgi:hypothetical protein
MRRQVLALVLQELPDDEIVRLIGEVARQGRQSAAVEVASLALADVLQHEDLGYERHVALYQRAKLSGDEVVARLLLSSGRQPGSDGRTADEPLWEPSTALGWRKTRARSSRREVLERLLFDPDPQVLEILLQNPRIVERDAVRLAARRPTTAAAQQVVFASRYACRLEVRRALVLNPYTPVELSARILPGLPRGEIQEIAHREDLAVALRQTAAALLRAAEEG